MPLASLYSFVCDVFCLLFSSLTFSKGQGSLCEGVRWACRGRQPVSKPAGGRTHAGFAHATEPEFVFQPKSGSLGQLKPEVLAGSFTAGNYVNSGSLHAGCSYADSCQRERDGAVEICERHVTSPQQLIAHSCVLMAEDTFHPYLMFGSAIFPKVPAYMGFVFIKASNIAFLFSQQVNNPRVNKNVSTLIETG